jgi:hypothetical protein
MSQNNVNNGFPTRFFTQEKTFNHGSADPRRSPMAVNLWLEIHQLKRIC